jgi:hypothetical protein
MRVDTGLIVNPSLYSACGQIINAGPGEVTVTVTMTAFGPDGNAYAATQSVQRMIPVGSSIAGCGFVRIVDYELHPDPVKYRLRVHYVFADRSVGDVEGEAGFR